MTMKALFINAAARQISVVEWQGLADLQCFAGGYIEAAHQWDNGDVLFVDEEAKLKPGRHWFLLQGVKDLVIGNGIIVGPATSECNHDGEVIRADPVMTLGDLWPLMLFGEDAA